ncbi:hypothetical protein D3C73_1034560 [compost metagenome]
MHQTFRMMHTFRHVPHLVAYRSPGHRVLGITFYFYNFTALLMHQQSAGVRAVQWTYRRKYAVLVMLQGNSPPLYLWYDDL